MLRQKIACGIVCGMLACWMLAGAASRAVGQDRETKVRNDRNQLAEDESWLYNDLETGFAEARRSGRPLLIVLRCIP